MAAEPQDSPMQGVPVSSENFGFCTEKCHVPDEDPKPGIRRVNLRAEVDTSLPFGSVKEAVTRFGGSGPWVPLYKFEEAYQGTEEFDIKKVEEQAAELEKDLIVKELETLDVLEELGTTKRIVEEVKRQLQNQALKCRISTTTPPDINSDDQNLPAPAIKEMKEEHYEQQQIRINERSSSPYCQISSPDLILMELKQAKLNLCKTINDLGMIQTSVVSLKKKMKREKALIEKTKEKLTPKAQNQNVANNVSAASANHGNFENFSNISRPSFQNSPKLDQMFIKLVESSKVEQNKPYMKTAKIRWVAAKKMEEAARAAEALAYIEMNALAEMKGLSINDQKSSRFALPEPEPSPRTPKFHRPEDEVSNKEVTNAMHKFAETNNSTLDILKKLEEASEEVKHSKISLEEAVNRVEIANLKQLDAKEALWRWIPEQEKKKQITYNASKVNNFHPPYHQQHIPRSPLYDLMNKQNPTINDEPKPVLKPTVSMMDMLSKKQEVSSEDCVVKRPNEDHGSTERQQEIALSQMLHEVNTDLSFTPRPDQKQYFTQRRKFGFIHISFPLTRQSKKKPQASNKMIQ